ncbi:hypothetical protein X777_16033 [Ooceraea biroi]|uniref:Uncharacterized protein n=1 Tax=Ooceraea biroi TaxID=2015173 RepID=A0A026WVW9_OOCBI|nr:hypothetical protein X777_16033 [Ooceraea biroi]
MIMEIFNAHCFAAIADLLHIPLIGVSTTSMYPWHSELIGQPENLAFVSNVIVRQEFPKTVWQRTYNTLHTLYCKLYFNYLTRPQDELVRKHFGPNLPSIQKMNLALILINTHIALHGIQPMTPAAVQIGGIQIREDDSPLPQVSQVSRFRSHCHCCLMPMKLLCNPRQSLPLFRPSCKY